MAKTEGRGLLLCLLWTFSPLLVPLPHSPTPQQGGYGLKHLQTMSLQTVGVKYLVSGVRKLTQAAPQLF